MSTKAHIGVSLPKETIAKIDKARGDISRSRFLWRILEEILSTHPMPAHSKEVAQ